MTVFIHGGRVTQWKWCGFVSFRRHLKILFNVFRYSRGYSTTSLDSASMKMPSRDSKRPWALRATLFCLELCKTGHLTEESLCPVHQIEWSIPEERVRWLDKTLPPYACSSFVKKCKLCSFKEKKKTFVFEWNFTKKILARIVRKVQCAKKGTSGDARWANSDRW